MDNASKQQCAPSTIENENARTGVLIAERVRVRILEVPITSIVPMSFSALTARRMCLVEVHADGLTGIGESWINYPDWAAEERIATVLQGAADMVLGADVSDPEAVTNRIASRLSGVGRQWGAPGPISQAISGIDLALWDLVAKRSGQPVHRMLTEGAVRDSVPAYASGVGPTDIVELCERAIERGFRAVKAKVGFGRETDQTTLDTINKVCGGEMRIFADANQAWDLHEAIEMSHLMASCGVEWLEEPIAGNHLGDLERFHEATSLPVATGENNYGYDEFLNYVRSPAVRYIQPDPAKCGGLTAAVRIAQVAQGTSCAVAPHWYGGALGLAAAVQLGAAYSNVDWIELDIRDNPLRTEIPARPWSLENGSLVVPQYPGLMGELNEEVRDAFQIKEAERTLHDVSRSR
ncbi:mandelate racemase/muconate lactonizing enzyme family protein [Arthrobacter castelli]|uniref:mandelate racemase/muconate lactonizing enzyme family protein n=1 Tax=Arthrobacter castelli TaxID=271431 RepID=UPI00041CE2CD|nr:mandelate racemase/muconate lactonizing enzyme family protein [Arthrobacter castelli]